MGNYCRFLLPTISEIGKTLRKLKVDNTIGIVVVPYWPTWPWFTKHVEMTSGEIFHFDMFANNLFLPFGTSQQHVLARKMKLLAIICRSKGYEQNASQARLLKLSLHENEKQPRRFYKSYLDRWTSFCKGKKTIPAEGTVQEGLEFFTKLYH